jgi:energy-coupling factor transport system ATP-binding protein
MDDVAALAGRVVVLEEGRVALHGPTRQVFAQVGRLQALGLGSPEAVSVMIALRKRGLAVPLDVLTLKEAEGAILAALSARPTFDASGDTATRAGERA